MTTPTKPKTALEEAIDKTSKELAPFCDCDDATCAACLVLSAARTTLQTEPQPTASGEAFERIVKYQLSSSSASYEEITGGEWLGDMMAVQKALAQPEPIDVAKNDFGDISEFNVKSGNMVNRVMVPVLGFETHEQRNAARKYLERGLLNGTAGEK